MALDPTEVALLDSITLGARGAGRKPRTEVQWDVVRPLAEGDLPTLLSPPPVAAEAQHRVQMRSTHHLLAQVLAKGTDETEAALITGYSISYISVLKGDPAFQELIDTYSQERKAIFVDVLERMRALGIATLEELQHRLETEPARFSNREMMEMTKLLLVETGHASGPKAGGGNAPVVQISFVQSEGVRPIIDVTPSGEARPPEEGSDEIGF